MTRIIDLCAGSGMLAHAAAYALADIDPTILSVDIDPAALAVCAACPSRSPTPEAPPRGRPPGPKRSASTRTPSAAAPPTSPPRAPTA